MRKLAEKKWRFPASNFGKKKGLNNGDIETFKKSPYQAFAREILQNSIDARNSDSSPVKVEFKEFEIAPNRIPGVEDLKTAIENCCSLWKDRFDYVEEYEKMKDVLNRLSITCLRISDYNTTGLIGVESPEQKNNQFLALTKGTGVSEKSGGLSGGSKGIGKNAAFLLSSLQTVFYSTVTNKTLNNDKKTNKGSIGVAEFVSGSIDKKSRDYTQGTGYFGNDKNSAFKELLDLDENFKGRKRHEYGTDIYIIGFQNKKNWENAMINSILDSFMAAIVQNQLEISINGREINKSTIKNIVYDNTIIEKNNIRNFISQYRLLTDGENRKEYDIDTEYGSLKLFILPFSENEEELATHKCVMIRYPLMKIKEIPYSKNFNISAMCIIDDNKLGSMLRSIENAQHIDWEPQRLKTQEKIREIKTILSNIRNEIETKIKECLKISNTDPLDPNGAGDFLPEKVSGDENTAKNTYSRPSEQVVVSKPKMNQFYQNKVKEYGDESQGLEPDIGGIDDAIDGDLLHPDGNNNKKGDEIHPGKETSGEKPGDNIIFKRSKLAGVKYKVMSLNKSNGLIRIIFTSPTDKDNCYLNISLLDDSNKSSNIYINSMKCNDIQVFSDDKIEYGPFSIATNQKIILDVYTNQKTYFASEVKVICK